MPVDASPTPRAFLVTGFGNSGVTAVMDLLAECDGVLCPAQEFFLIQHPDGILALEDALVQSAKRIAKRIAKWKSHDRPEGRRIETALQPYLWPTA